MQVYDNGTSHLSALSSHNMTRTYTACTDGATSPAQTSSDNQQSQPHARPASLSLWPYQGTLAMCASQQTRTFVPRHASVAVHNVHQGETDTYSHWEWSTTSSQYTDAHSTLGHVWPHASQLAQREAILPHHHWQLLETHHSCTASEEEWHLQCIQGLPCGCTSQLLMLIPTLGPRRGVLVGHIQKTTSEEWHCTQLNGLSHAGAEWCCWEVQPNDCHHGQMPTSQIRTHEHLLGGSY